MSQGKDGGFADPAGTWNKAYAKKNADWMTLLFL